jgi:hypothetical protein
MNAAAHEPAVPRPASTSAAWTKPPAGAKGCHRTLDEIALVGAGRRGQARRLGAAARAPRGPAAPARATEPGGLRHESAGLLLRPHLALCLPGLRAAAAGAGRAAATPSNTARCCWPACCSTGARRARPRSSPSAPGPSATCTGWPSSTASALDTPAQHPFNPLPLLRLALASSATCGPTGVSWRRCFATCGWAAPTPGSGPPGRADAGSRPCSTRPAPPSSRRCAPHRSGRAGGCVRRAQLRRCEAGCSGAWMRCPCCATR